METCAKMLLSESCFSCNTGTGTQCWTFYLWLWPQQLSLVLTKVWRCLRISNASQMQNQATTNIQNSLKWIRIRKRRRFKLQSFQLLPRQRLEKTEKRAKKMVSQTLLPQKKKMLRSLKRRMQKWKMQMQLMNQKKKKIKKRKNLNFKNSKIQLGFSNSRKLKSATQMMDGINLFYLQGLVVSLS